MHKAEIQISTEKKFSIRLSMLDNIFVKSQVTVFTEIGYRQLRLFLEVKNGVY